MKGFLVLQGLLAQFQMPGAELEKVAAENAREAGSFALGLLILKIAIPLLFIVFGIVVISLWIVKGLVLKVLTPKQRGIYLSRGRVWGICRNGPVWMLPFWHRTIVVDIDVQSVDLKKEMVRTTPEEGYFLHLVGAIYFQVIGGAAAIDGLMDPAYSDSDAFKKAILASHYAVNNLRELIENLAFDHLRSVVSSKKLAQIFEEKDAIAKDLTAHLDQALQIYGIQVTRVTIVDVKLPDDVVAASNAKLRDEREGDAAIVKAKKAAEASIEAAKGQAIADTHYGEGAANRVRALATGLVESVKAMTGGEEISLDAAGAIAFLLQQEKFRTDQVIGAHAKHTFFMGGGADGTTAETMSTIMAILAAEGAQEHGSQVDDIESAFEQALEHARKAQNEDLVKLLEANQARVRETMAQMTERVGRALEASAGKIPVVGKRVARKVHRATAAATEAVGAN